MSEPLQLDGEDGGRGGAHCSICSLANFWCAWLSPGGARGALGPFLALGIAI